MSITRSGLDCDLSEYRVQSVDIFRAKKISFSRFSSLVTRESLLLLLPLLILFSPLLTLHRDKSALISLSDLSYLFPEIMKLDS